METRKWLMSLAEDSEAVIAVTRLDATILEQFKLNSTELSSPSARGLLTMNDDGCGTTELRISVLLPNSNTFLSELKTLLDTPSFWAGVTHQTPEEVARKAQRWLCSDRVNTHMVDGEFQPCKKCVAL